LKQEHGPPRGLKTGQNRRAFDDGSGLAAQVTQLPRTSAHGHEYNASGVVLQFRARRAPVFGAEIPAVPATVCATHSIASASEQHVEWRPALLLAPPLILTLLIQVEQLSWHPLHPCHPSTRRRFPRRSSSPVRSLPRAVTRRLGPLWVHRCSVYCPSPPHILVPGQLTSCRGGAA